MREIKFRIFNLQSKTMISEGIGLMNYKAELERPDMYRVMQFTGLKDKNGKEIFEGDIVRWICKTVPTNNENIYHIGKVVFISGHFRVDAQKYYLSYLQCSDLETGEVIGNICENPELLNDKN